MVTKTCLTCGRIIEPRKKWLKNWDEIKYCGDRCRRNKVTDDYESRLLVALKALPSAARLDPNEILTAADQADAQKIQKVRSAARRLHAKGLITITQNSKPVDPSTARGRIELKLIRKNL